MKDLNYNETDITKVIQAVRELIQGRTNAAGNTNITLIANATSITITDALCTPTSVIDFMPLSFNSAIAKSTMFVSNRSRGSFTITHSNNSQTDRTFAYAIRSL